MLKHLSLVISFVLLTACSSTAYNPLDDYNVVEPDTRSPVTVVESSYDPALVARGQNLARLLACGTCHTDGALVGRPDENRIYAGSNIGIAYSNPFVIKQPAIVYPPNITPDPGTGIGSWTDDEIIRVIRTGIDNHGRGKIPIMPWPGYAEMTDADARAIVAFLRSLKPVRHQQPANVRAGQKASAPYVHFGVYQSRDLTK